VTLRLDPSRTDEYSVDQRGRIRRFVDAAPVNFGKCSSFPAKDDHFDGGFDDTADTLARYLCPISHFHLAGNQDGPGDDSGMAQCLT
jgi:hypothetical protein